MRILAGIVSYNPEFGQLIAGIGAVVNQVDRLVVVDNGSRNSQEIIDEIKKYNSEIVIISNTKNIGIAGALNQILEFGITHGFEWVLTLDQDSTVPKDIISKFKVFMLSDVGIICPKIVDINMKEEIDSNITTEIKNPEDIITSGSCINLGIAKRLHGFDERLFIDYVDTEFQNRVLINGYRIIQVSSVRLLHEVGHMTEKNIVGYRVLCSNHSPTRRYYQVRNRLYYRKKYFGSKDLLKEKIRLILGTIKIICYENDKGKKVKATIKGFRDYKLLLNGDIYSRL